jgi:hypothetical protein
LRSTIQLVQVGTPGARNASRNGSYITIWTKIYLMQVHKPSNLFFFFLPTRSLKSELLEEGLYHPSEPPYSCCASVHLQQLWLLKFVLLSSFLFLYLPFPDQKSFKKASTRFLGLPIIGQSLSFLSAMRKNTAEGWLQVESESMALFRKWASLGPRQCSSMDRQQTSSSTLATATFLPNSNHRP